MNDTLFILETLTADARRECAAGTNRASPLIKARHSQIVHLCDLIKHGALISAAELERIRVIEKGGAEILESVRVRRTGLLDKLRMASLQHSFANCVEGILGRPRPRVIDS